MPAPAPDTYDFDAFLVPTQEQQDLCLDTTSRNPALALPPFPGDDPAFICEPGSVPSCDEIEAELLAYVAGGPPPRAFLSTLFHPFEDVLQFHIDTGRGQKRPTCKIEFFPFEKVIGRASVKRIAAELHEMATSLAACAIGDRAPAAAPTFWINHSESRPYFSIRMKAASFDHARRALRVFYTGWRVPTYTQVPISTPDLASHIAVARDLHAARVLEQSPYRKMAVDLINAVADLRLAGTIALRRAQTDRWFRRCRIKIPLAETSEIYINDDGAAVETAHEKIAFLKDYRGVFDALRQIRRRHPVLETLPDSLSISLSGEVAYLHPEIIVTAAGPGQANQRITSGDLEYQAVSILETQLGAIIEGTPSPEKQSWILQLSGNQIRSRGSWYLEGPTLAHAIAQTYPEDETRALAEIIDLMIDLSTDTSGSMTEVQLYRKVADA